MQPKPRSFPRHTGLSQMDLQTITIHLGRRNENGFRTSHPLGSTLARGSLAAHGSVASVASGRIHWVAPVAQCQ